MKILYLSPSLSRIAGGIFEIEKSLAQGLHRRNVEIVAVGRWDSKWELDKGSWEPVDATCFPSSWPQSFSRSRSLGRYIERNAHDFDFLHLHALWLHTSILTNRWFRLTQRPYVVTPNGMLDPWAMKHRSWKKLLALAFFERKLLRNAACLHANTEKELEDIRNLGFTNAVAIIPNGVAVPTNKKSIQKAKQILFLGRLHDKKGLFELIRGWKLIQTGIRQDWRLAIAGWDNQNTEAALRELVYGLELSDSIDFLGPVFGDKKITTLSNAAAFVLPSFSEGLPMAVLEAWAHRLPTIITKNCNLQIGFDRDAAIEVLPTPSSIASGLSTIMTMHPEQRTSMGDNGRRLVEEFFNWDVVASEMHSVYQWLNGGPKPACVHLPKV